jgi:PAS domain S-box-containing protein
MKPSSASDFHSAAQLEHGRLTSLINSMADGVIALDQACNIVLYNGAALNILDSNRDVEGQPLGSIFKPVDKEGNPVDVTTLVKNAKTPTVNRDMLLRYTDDSKINLYLSIAPVHLGYGAGGERGYVLMLRDITREKSLEEERDEFISVVSHELRTPIAISEGDISNAQYIAEKQGEDDSIKKALQEAHGQILFLADMINDLSTLSRAERGILTIDAEEFSPKDLLDELYDNYEAQARDRGLKLVIKASPGLKPLRTSKLYVREILQNFITNALKYTQQGHVTIAAKQHGEAVAFSVTDTGIGISKQDQKRVFDKFFRSEDYRTRATNGTGLGLYVTQKLIHLLRAEVQVDSKLNHGSTFTVIIPSTTEQTKN